MTQLEQNACAAVIAYLVSGGTSTDAKVIAAAALLTALVPEVWNSKTDVSDKTPRLSVKAQQGEEMVWGTGLYKIRIECESQCQATDPDSGNAIDAAVQTLLGDQGYLDIDLTSNGFFCYGQASGLTSAPSSENINRNNLASMELVGFDSSRFS